jgi:hypothetical protein
MTSPEIMSFDDRGKRSNSLVYNNLFPGAGLYGWKQDMVVAVDSIFLREDGMASVQSPLLANVVAWLVWRMESEQADPERIVEMVQRLGILVDGYVINVVRKVHDQIEGYKLILAREEAKIVRLGDKNGDYLKQVNIVDPAELATKWALPPRNIWKGGWKYFTSRIKTLDAHARSYGSWCEGSLESDQVARVHHTIQSMVYGELASFYVHADLGALCIGLVDLQTGTSVSCKLNTTVQGADFDYLDWMHL